MGDEMEALRERARASRLHNVGVRAYAIARACLDLHGAPLPDLEKLAYRADRALVRHAARATALPR